MNVMRVVVTGAVGAGKSTFVRTVGELGTISTERLATDAEAIGKPMTTVAFDFGQLTLNSGQVMHIYGTPGQDRFDFMWDILMRHAHSHLLLIDAHRPDHLSLALDIIQFMEERSHNPTVIGLTHMDCENALTPSYVLAALGYTDLGHSPPAITINPHDKSSVLNALAVIADGVNHACR